MSIEKLEKLGLNKTEALVYVTLLDIGASNAGKISKKSKINRTTVYDSINRLLDKGLVTYVLQSNRKVFKAVSPTKLLEIIRDQETIAKEILPELEMRFKSSKETETSSIYEGKKGIKSILCDILKTKEYVCYGSSGKFLDIMKHDYLLFQKSKKDKKIIAHVIFSENAKKSESVKYAYSTFKYLPEEFISPTTTFVYENNIAIIVWSEIPIATVIQNKEVAKSYRNYFKLIWKTAKY
ncbi:MAG: helix-turn-helix domain-containing protein [Nanoarchaeota archaeon]|nr:helix-turn-helix domain-containing protein [Nanoarchaeota archaeon]MBU1270351.1 helix-turn-helix domain-containing protein [Nanoarchaeota archaeon]MBU1604666.1 helix-turn-helix domain-containing protein [Nanoarchaeota archaeon]MBU2443143.1 helix-turn-helix domain-containing protein [Nanoarchaeota archaeon]